MRRGRSVSESLRRPTSLPERGGAHVIAARRLNRAAGLLALSVLLDSALEHYRGDFKNKAMLTPLVIGGLALAVSVHGTGDKRARAHRARDATYVLAALTGLVGTGFHIYNVLKRPGGMAWQNVFYGAPLGAPTAILLSGLLGFYSERVRDNPDQESPTVFGIPADSGRTYARGALRGGAARYERRSRSVAFSRRLPQSSHVFARDCSSGRRGFDGADRIRS